LEVGGEERLQEKAAVGDGLLQNDGTLYESGSVTHASCRWWALGTRCCTRLQQQHRALKKTLVSFHYALEQSVRRLQLRALLHRGT
jgi:hypothetical protein